MNLPTPTPSPAPNAQILAQALQDHLQWCQRSLELLERENRTLTAGQAPAWEQVRSERKGLLTELNRLVECLRAQRMARERRSPAKREPHPLVNLLLRSNTDMVMKIAALDRENEQLLLRHGLLPPGHAQTAAPRHQPHFATEVYRRHALE